MWLLLLTLVGEVHVVVVVVVVDFGRCYSFVVLWLVIEVACLLLSSAVLKISFKIRHVQAFPHRSHQGHQDLQDHQVHLDTIL
jgi:hypothetical protein